MKRYLLQRRNEIIKIRYKNGKTQSETISTARTFLGCRKAPCRTAIPKFMEKVDVLGQVKLKLKNNCEYSYCSIKC